MEPEQYEKSSKEAAGNAMRPVNRTSVSGEIVAQISDLIARGLLRPGDRLPPERELCKRFGVGRSSLREALRSLAVMGILDGRVGEGTFVCDNGQHLLKTLEWGFRLDGKELEDLAETRMMLESQNASLAAERATNDDIEAISAALLGMEKAVGDLGRFLESDLEFHLLIAQATHNTILIGLLETTRNYLQEWIKESLAEPSRARGRATLSMTQHRNILEAIKRRDVDGAHQAMATHIRSSSVDLRNRAEQTLPMQRGVGDILYSK